MNLPKDPYRDDHEVVKWFVFTREEIEELLYKSLKRKHNLIPENVTHWYMVLSTKGARLIFVDRRNHHG